MRKQYLWVAVSIWMLWSCRKPAQVTKPEALFPVPSVQQIQWHQLETYAFIHFTTNTFTGKEWGYGDESPAIFNPTQLDVDQWIRTIKEAGLKTVILTAKHHDGFCLWPSKYTDHSIASSPYKNGKGDLVREVSEACKKYGLKFGIYLSPWDRNHPYYGTPKYIEYYRNQLKELMTNYGTVYEMWFDGANGGDGYYGGKNTVVKIDGRTYYDWTATIRMVREMQPDILFFSDGGPDIRWVGNERGLAGVTNWNNITPDTLYAGKAGIESLLNTGNENGTHWIPAEVDVSIRPGWFYHAEEDSKVKTSEQLFDIYLTSVGRGSNLLLNIPPDRRGLIHEVDVENLKGYKKLLDDRLSHNLVKGMKVKTSAAFDKTQSARNLTDGDSRTFWASANNSAQLEIEWKNKQKVSYFSLSEYIPLGQRVKAFKVEIWDGSEWKKVAEGTTIGYKRILKIDPIETSRLRISILDAKGSIVLNELEIF